MEKTTRQIFWSSFIDGLAAPLALFSARSAPTVRSPQITPMYRPAPSASEALRHDARRIGEDFRRSIGQRNGEK